MSATRSLQRLSVFISCALISAAWLVGCDGSKSDSGSTGGSHGSAGGSAGGGSGRGAGGGPGGSTGNGAGGSASTSSGGSSGGGGSGPDPSVAAGCAAEPLRTTGKVTYFCDTGSDSSGDGSSAKPYQSFTKAAATFASLNAGDTIAFCRGGKWTNVGETFDNKKCTTSATCDIRDYGDASKPAPSFTTNSGPILNFMHNPEAGHQGYRVLNLALQGGSNANAFSFYNQTTDVDVCNVTMDGFNTAVNITSGDGDQPVYGPSKRIRFRGCTFTNASNIAFMSGGEDIVIEDSVFQDCGSQTATEHSVYFASYEYDVGKQVVVPTSQRMRMTRTHISYKNKKCMGSPLVIHGRHQDAVVENSIVEADSADDNCYGPGTGCGGYPYGCWFRNTIIRGNTFRNLGNSVTDNSLCKGCLIENNLIISPRQVEGVTLGGTDQPRGSNSSAYPSWDGYPDDPMQNVIVRNNTIVFTGSAVGTGIHEYGGTGYTFINNAIYFQTKSGGNASCFQVDDNPASVLTAEDRNVCLLPSSGSWANGSSLKTWQGKGYDAHSLQTDPMFANVGGGDYTPAAGSPLIGLSDPSNSPTVDLNGKSRGSAPDVGAFQH